MSPPSSEHPPDRDEALGRVVEDVEELIEAGRPVDAADLARRYGLEEADVTEVVRALEVMGAALVEPIVDRDAEADAEVPPELPPGYEMLGEIGRGGMGVVYKARQQDLGRVVAVKVLRPGAAMGPTLERFRKEARSLARLRHPHIVSVHEVGKAGSQVFFSMDWIEGEPLDRLLKQGAVTQSQAVRLLRQITSAIAYSHSRGVVHRDIKPANILVDSDGNAFVVDFGLALDLGSEDALTHTGQIIGTVGYMSPEQARGEGKRIGEASDIYALGVILYECLTGEAPFAGLSVGEIIHAILHVEPVPPHKVDPKVPRELERVCLQAMHKDPEKRYVTARALLEDLERFEEGREVRARSPGLFERLRAGYRRHRTSVRVGVVAALLAGLLVFSLLAGRGGQDPEALLDTARTLFDDGKHVAAAAVCERALDEQGGLDPRLPPSDPRRVRRGALHELRIRCLLENGKQIELEGRRAEAVAAYERALAAFEEARPLFRDTYPPRGELEFDIRWALALCQGERGGEHESRGYEDLLASLPGSAADIEAGSPRGIMSTYYRARRRLLDLMAPALRDKIHPQHENAKLVFLTLYRDPAFVATVNAWLRSRGQAPSLDMLLASLSPLAMVTPQQPSDALGERSAAPFLATRRWRHELFADTDALVERLALYHPAQTREVLWKGATEWRHLSEWSRAWMVHWLSRAADIPVYLEKDERGVPQPDAAREEEILRLFQQVGAASRAEGLEVRRHHANRTLAAAESDGDEALAVRLREWLSGHRAPLLPAEDLASNLRAYLLGKDADRARAQHRLWMRAPARIEPPVWRQDEGEPAELPMAWVRGLAGVASPPPLHVSANWWVFVDGVLSRRAWMDSRLDSNAELGMAGVARSLSGFTSVQTKARGDGLPLLVRMRVPGLAYQPRTPLISQPGSTRLFFRAQTVLRWEVDGPRLHVSDPLVQEILSASAEPPPWQGALGVRNLIAGPGGVVWKRFERVAGPSGPAEPALSAFFAATLVTGEVARAPETASAWSDFAATQLASVVARSSALVDGSGAKARERLADDARRLLSTAVRLRVDLSGVDLTEIPGDRSLVEPAAALALLHAGRLDAAAVRRMAEGALDLDVGFLYLGLSWNRPRLEFWLRVHANNGPGPARALALREIERIAMENGWKDERFLPVARLYAQAGRLAAAAGEGLPAELEPFASAATELGEAARVRQGPWLLLMPAIALLAALLLLVLAWRRDALLGGALGAGLVLATFNVLWLPDRDLCLEVIGYAVAAAALFRIGRAAGGPWHLFPAAAFAAAALATGIERLEGDLDLFGRAAMITVAAGVLSMPLVFGLPAGGGVLARYRRWKTVLLLIVYAGWVVSAQLSFDALDLWIPRDLPLALPGLVACVIWALIATARDLPPRRATRA